MRRAALVIALTACSEPGPQPTGLDGEWALSWTCVSGCEYRPPSVSLASAAVVDGATVTWSTAPALAHDGVRDGDCLAVPVGSDAIGRQRAAYSLCASGDAIAVEIGEYHPDGTAQALWRMTGTR